MKKVIQFQKNEKMVQEYPAKIDVLRIQQERSFLWESSDKMSIFQSRKMFAEKKRTEKKENELYEQRRILLVKAYQINGEFLRTFFSKYEWLFPWM